MPIAINYSQTSPAPTDFAASSGIHTAGADYSVPFDTLGGVLGEPIWFVNGRGEEVNLSTMIDEQFKAGLTGRWSAPVQHFSEPVPEQDGERYRGSRVLPNQVIVPITLVANSLPELRGKVRELARAMNPKNGMGELHVVTEDGLHRFINCIPESFPTDDPSVDGELYDAVLNLSFRAFDPFWYDAQYVERVWENNSADGTFFGILPISLGASSIDVSEYSEWNEGDTEAWPIWVVTGPGSEFSFTNDSTGEYTAFHLDIPEGEQLVIDTRPGVKRVYFASNPYLSLFPYFYGSLWSLQAGDNQVTVNLKESSGNSLIQFGYRPGYLGV